MRFIIFVIDGPNNPANPNGIEVPECYSGFWLIEASDEAKAKELALAGSLACNRKVELRPYL